MILDYRRDIDGLRAIAVLLVLFYHLDIPLFGGGFVGVDVFFVISGYLITGIITRQMGKGGFSFAEFYARRIKRIFPALFVMLLVSAVVAFFMLAGQEYKQFFRAFRFTSLQASNFFFMQKVDYFARDQAPSALLHTWSLGVEEQFYLFWPLLLALGFKLKSTIQKTGLFTVLFIISLAASAWLVQSYVAIAFYMLPTRAWELMIGGLLASPLLPVVRGQRVKDVVSLLSLIGLIAVAVTYDESHFPGLKALAPCLFSALLIHTAKQGQGIGHRILSMRGPVFIGLISYSLYLWHWPFIAFYKSFVGDVLTVTTQGVIAILSILFAALSYKFVEQPARHINWSSRKVILTGVAVIAASMLFVEVMRSLQESPIRMAQPVNERMQAFSPIAKRCFMKESFDENRMCHVGTVGSTKKALLIGSSHAGHYAETVDAWGRANNVDIGLVMRDGCGTWFNRPDDSDEKKCAAFTDDVADFLAKSADQKIRYDYIFLAIRAESALQARIEKEKSDEAGSTVFKADIDHGLSLAGAAAHKVIVLGQVPLFDKKVHACYESRSLRLAAWLHMQDRDTCLKLDADRSEDVLRPSGDILRSAVARHGFSYFDPAFYIHSGFGENPHVFLYKDRDHLNTDGGLFLAPYLEKFMALQN